MSWQWVRPVFEADLRPASVKLVALNLAERADEEGVSFPGYRIIARETGLTQMTVSRALKKLRTLGVVAIEKGRQHSTSTYRLSAHRLLELATARSNIVDEPALTITMPSSNNGDTPALTSLKRNRHREPSSRTTSRNQVSTGIDFEERYCLGKNRIAKQGEGG